MLKNNPNPKAQMRLLETIMAYQMDDMNFGPYLVADYLNEDLTLRCHRTGLNSFILVPRVVPKGDDPYGRIILDSTMKGISGFDPEKALNAVMNQSNKSFTFPTPKVIEETTLMSLILSVVNKAKPGIIIADLYDHFHGLMVHPDHARFLTIVIGPVFIQLEIRAALSRLSTQTYS